MGSSWAMGASKSCRSIVTLANLFASGPVCVLWTASWRAVVAVLPSFVLGVMKPRDMRW